MLAAITFADPLMLAGLVAALIPIILHLLSRMRAPVVPFPTLRFLRLTSQKTARRRHLQQYFLLLLRVIVFALIAMAVAAPLIRGGNAGLAYGFVGMLLAGLVFLVLAATFTRAALDKRKLVQPAGSRASSSRGSSAAVLWGGSLATILASLFLGGYAAYGLVSDRYFSSAGGGEFTGQSTALVILLDNSHSMLARDTPPASPDAAASPRSRLQIAIAQAQQLLGQTLRPREAAILTTNPLDPPLPTGLTTDMTALRGHLEQIVSQGPQSAASPMQERIRAALDILGASAQPDKMLVIVSDFARPAFGDAEVFAPLRKTPWRRDLQVVFMPARSTSDTADVGITRFALAEGTQRAVVGAEVTFEAQVVNNAQTADVRDIAFTVDGQPLATGPGSAAPMMPRVQLAGAGGDGAEGAGKAEGGARTTVQVPFRLTQAGPHRFGIQLQNSPDAWSGDDSRELLLDVAEQVRVLVVGAEAPDARGNPRSRSAAFYFQAALAPFSGGDVPWSIKPTYRGIDQVQSAAALQGYAAVFLCDVPRISPALADALVAYNRGPGTTGGGRIVWVLGPSVNQAAYNDVLLGSQRQLLPAPLGPPVTTSTALPVDWVDLRSGIFMNLFDSQDPFRTALITGHWTLNGEAQGVGGRALAKLAGNSSLVVQHGIGGAAGTGRRRTHLHATDISCGGVVEPGQHHAAGAHGLADGPGRF